MRELARKTMFDYIPFVLAIAVAVFGVYTYFKDPQVAQASEIKLLTSRVNYIESDGMLHIQDNITDLKIDVRELRAEQKTQGENVAEILGILNRNRNAN